MLMKRSELKDASTIELQKLQEVIQEELDSREGRIQAIEELKELAREKGLSLEDLLKEAMPEKASKKGTGAKVAPKYAHPKDPELTWTGRGKQPLWVKELIDEGHSMSDLEIA